MALYHSLLINASHFHLFIFTFDIQTYKALSKLNLAFVTLISLNEFETADLLKVKRSRTVAEYCWTCTPAVILHCLEKHNLFEVCYLDADLFFWGDPAILLSEANESSILITEHRYTPDYDQSVASGKYCVQFMYFKNNLSGINALIWWRDACIQWCYNRVEDGKFGDQKYLDDWTTRFEGVKVLEHLGGGVAPWNVQQYSVDVSNEKIELKETSTGKIFPLIFYHFHALKFVDDQIDFGGYKLSQKVIQNIYHPYVKALLAQEKSLQTTMNLHGRSTSTKTILNTLRRLKSKWQGIDNQYAIAEFKLQD
jgi:hypothetical protein